MLGVSVLLLFLSSASAASLSSPLELSSGNEGPSTWSLSLSVREHRHSNDLVAFNTRSYCYKDICSYPGPTIRVRAGDNFTLTIVNELHGSSGSDLHVMNTMNSPNVTNFHTHGLHIDPNVDDVFLRAEPGESLVYKFQIPINHGSGMMWYHDHLHGSSTLKVMGGLVGGLFVEPSSWENIPQSIVDMETHVMILTRIKFDQSVDHDTQELNQGCGTNWTCDPFVQYPMCNGSSEEGPPISPYESFRIYSYIELSRETGSTLDINAHFSDPSIQDMMLVNGQYNPILQNVGMSEPVLLQIVAALGGGLVTLEFPSPSSCEMTVIAYDGVYLRSAITVDTVRLVEGGRADVQVMCTSPGIFELRSSGGDAMFQLNVSQQEGIESSPVTDSELGSIIRPSYLDDLITPDVVVNSQYSVAFWQNAFNNSKCGFWMGVGTNCSARGAEAAESPNLCNYSQFSGSLGTDPKTYTSRGKLVTWVNAINEWEIYGEDSFELHPFHIHVNHFQIVSYTPHGDGSPDAYKSYFEIGQFRDTIPLYDGKIVIRFLAADFAGEVVTHCHFLRHEDLGMMDTFLVSTSEDLLYNNDESSNESTVDLLSLAGVAIGGFVVLSVVVGGLVLFYKHVWVRRRKSADGVLSETKSPIF